MPAPYAPLLARWLDRFQIEIQNSDRTSTCSHSKIGSQLYLCHPLWLFQIQIKYFLLSIDCRSRVRFISLLLLLACDWLEGYVPSFLSLWLELSIREMPAPSAPLRARQPDQFQNRHRTSTCSSTGSVWNSTSAPLLACRPNRTSTSFSTRSVPNSNQNQHLYELVDRISLKDKFRIRTSLACPQNAVPFFLSLWLE